MSEDAAGAGGALPPFCFDGADLSVRARPVPGSDQLVITFSGRAAKPPGMLGFGEDYFLKRDISAIHFISKANHWWQTAELSEAIAVLRGQGLLDGPERITVYGSSMGGFAAMIRSRELGADQIITVSPQYSIDGAVVPFERRWRNYAAKLAFGHDDMAAGLDRDVPLWAVIDPLFAPDMGHVHLIERLRPISRIAVPFAGHNTARVLEECGLMQSMIVDLVRERFDLPKLHKDYRRRRISASLFWFGVAEAFVARGRAGWAAAPAAFAAEMVGKGARMRDRSLLLQIYRLAIATACERGDATMARHWLDLYRAQEPGERGCALSAARLAALGSDPEEAFAQAETARRLLNDDPAAIALLIEVQANARDEPSALRLAEHHAPRHPRVGAVQLALARRQRAAGQIDAARETVAEAIKRGGREDGLRLLLAEIHLDQGRGSAAQRSLRPLLAGTMVAGPDRDATYALARRCGLKPEAERFAARGRRTDFLYATALRLRGGIAEGDPAGSMGRVYAELKRAMPRPKRADA